MELAVSRSPPASRSPSARRVQLGTAVLAAIGQRVQMRWIPIVLLGAHGFLHLLGFAKAFGYADLPEMCLLAPGTLIEIT